MEESHLPAGPTPEETVSLEQAQVNTVSSSSPQKPMPFAWNYSKSQSMDNVKRARAQANMSHGMYSGVPIVCQGAKCPFRATCWIAEADLEIGGRCPIEVGTIIERFDKYMNQFQVGETDEDTVDQGLIKDLIDIEILMVRADNALAISGDFIEEVVTGTDSNGHKLTKPELHRAFEAKSRLRAERIKVLNQMNSTRKDKKFEGAGMGDPSTQATELMQKLKRLQQEGKIGNVIDVTPVAEAKEKE